MTQSTPSIPMPTAVTGNDGLVVSQHFAASAAGAEVLRAGGSAMDAVVATALVLSVVEPWMSGLGGIGYIIAGSPGRTPEVIDFSARSPDRIAPADYPVTHGISNDFYPWPAVKDDRNVRGPLAICAPTLSQGLECAWSRHGRMPWAELVQPAIDHARKGIPLDWYTQLIIGSAASELQSDPDTADVFLNPDGTGRATGWTATSTQNLTLPNLAGTLECLARDGSDALICGDLALAIVGDIQDKGGRITPDDLAASRPAIRAPDRCTFPQGATLWTVPGQSGGPAVQRMLRAWYGDANPPAAMTSEDFRSHQATTGIRILQERLGGPGAARIPVETPSCTTNFLVIDRFGFVVAVTQSLLSLFGSKVLLPQTGILMNNAVALFDPVPGRPNSIGPAKRPLANMSPTLLEAADGRWIAIAASGGRRIMPAIAQILGMLIASGCRIDEAMAEPRMDFAADGTIVADDRLPRRTVEALHSVGTVLTVKPTIFPFNFAIVNTAERTRNGTIRGVAEPFCPHAATGTA